MDIFRSAYGVPARDRHTDIDVDRDADELPALVFGKIHSPLIKFNKKQLSVIVVKIPLHLLNTDDPAPMKVVANGQADCLALLLQLFKMLIYMLIYALFISTDSDSFSASQNTILVT